MTIFQRHGWTDGPTDDLP